MRFPYLILALFTLHAFGSEPQNCEGIDKAACRKLLIQVLEVKKKIDPAVISFMETVCTKNIEPVACIGLALFDSEKASAFKKEYLKVLEAECKLKDAIACWGAAQAYGHGFQTTVSEKKAKELHEKGCSENLSLSCTANGFLLQFDDKKPEITQALEFYNKGCELKDSAGCHFYGAVHLKGEKKNDATSVEYFKKACDLHHYEGCRILGALQYQKSETQTEGTRNLIKSCALGEAMGCKMAGFFYLQDIPERSIEKGIQYFERGCLLKDGESCLEAGSLYSKGVAINNEKIEIDKEKSFELLAAACDLDMGKACSIIIRRMPAGTEPSKEAIGKACLDGDDLACRNGGAEYKEEKLIEAATAKCDAKDAEACLSLANYHGDDVRRVNQFQIQACDAGHVETCYNLGEEFVNEALVGDKKRSSQMYSSARNYYNTACKLKHQPSCIRLKQIK
jgi:TPR repeat protein